MYNIYRVNLNILYVLNIPLQVNNIFLQSYIIIIIKKSYNKLFLSILFVM